MIDHRKIVDVLWYSQMDGSTIGIVLYDTGFGHKCYIGYVPGYDEKADQLHIAQTGARFHHGAALWPDVKEWAR